LAQPGLEKEQHHAPRTTSHAAVPPSGGPASSTFVASPGLSLGIGPLASSGSRSLSPLRSDSGCAAFSGSVFRSCMVVVFWALFVLAMVKTSWMVAAAVTMGGISTYQGIVMELGPKGSDLKLKRKWKKWRLVSGDRGKINKPADWILQADFNWRLILPRILRVLTNECHLRLSWFTLDSERERENTFRGTSAECPRRTFRAHLP